MAFVLVLKCFSFLHFVCGHLPTRTSFAQAFLQKREMIFLRCATHGLNELLAEEEKMNVQQTATLGFLGGFGAVWVLSVIRAWMLPIMQTMQAALMISCVSIAVLTLYPSLCTRWVRPWPNMTPWCRGWTLALCALGFVLTALALWLYAGEDVQVFTRCRFHQDHTCDCFPDQTTAGAWRLLFQDDTHTQLSCRLSFDPDFFAGCKDCLPAVSRMWQAVFLVNLHSIVVFAFLVSLLFQPKDNQNDEVAKK